MFLCLDDYDITHLWHRIAKTEDTGHHCLVREQTIVTPSGDRTMRQITIMYSVSQSPPPCGFLTFFPKRVGIF